MHLRTIARYAPLLWILACGENDEDGDNDSCAGVMCITPPVARCNDGAVITFASTGTCNDGECSYAQTRTACDSPPANFCEGDVAVAYASTAGTCAQAMCRYASQEVDCSLTGQTCSQGMCMGMSNLCGGMACTSPPGNGCEGSIALVYPNPGMCNNNSCEYEPTTTDCALEGKRCEDGACIEGMGMNALAECTESFDGGCPDMADICGGNVGFSGGDGCVRIGVGRCYTSGRFSYRVTDSTPLTISSDEDINRVSVYFVHQNMGGSGTMVFRDDEDARIDELTTSGACQDDASKPPVREITLPRAARSIEVTASTGSNVWLDTLVLNGTIE